MIQQFDRLPRAVKRPYFFRNSSQIQRLAGMNEGQGWASPRKTLFLSRQRASTSILEFPSAKPQYKQGAKPSEVYGFVGLISTTVASVVFFLWAYFPESWLHSVGITYYPSRF